MTQQPSGRARISSLTVEDPRTVDAGSRIRDFHLHRGLAEMGDVTMFTFPAKDVSGAAPRELDVDVRVQPPRHPVHAAVTSLAGRGLYHVARFDYARHDPALTEELNRSRIVHVSMLYGLPAALERLPARGEPRPTVVWDTHNYDPDVWTALRSVSPKRYAWYWRLQRRRVEQLIPRLAASVDVIVCCSDEDAEKTARLTGREAAVHVVPNGVEVDAWTCTPDPGTERYAIFASLNRPQNVAGIAWFLGDVWPDLHARRPEAQLVVLGRSPTTAVRELVAAAPNAQLRPDPADLRAEVDGSSAILVPQVAGVGSKLKLLEALATGLPVIASPAATVGVPPELREHVRIATDAAAWSRALSIGPRTPREREALRSTLLATVDWSTIRRQFADTLGVSL